MQQVPGQPPHPARAISGAAVVAMDFYSFHGAFLVMKSQLA